jgi:hypothetical protein
VIRLCCGRFPNGRQNTFQIGGHRIVRKAHDPISSERKQSLTIGVVFALRLVDAAIEFDDQPPIGTAEVGNEWSNWVLTTEL